ncbi:MAG: outer membrane protein assembly factor BamD [Verrucomicrobiota bacterium]
MNRRLAFLFVITACVALVPFRAPAPLVYTPGEGWTYEPVGGEGKWRRTRAKDQMDVAQAAFEKQDYNLTLKAARYLVKTWPLSDYAPRAQYLVGRCYEAKHNDEKAFSQYQKILEKYPKSENVKEVLQRQYGIAGRFLKGQRFKLWGYIPAFRSMDRTADMFDKIVKNGPYGDVAPHAQLRIGAAREKQSHYPEAIKAYESAADRYHDRPQIAADAIYRAGIAYQKQAKTAEYDQSMAGQAIAQFTDFVTLYPDDRRVPEAQQIMTSLKAEQARGNFETAKYYEKRSKWSGALVYYNEVVLHDPNSAFAAEARKRIDTIKRRTQTARK